MSEIQDLFELAAAPGATHLASAPAHSPGRKRQTSSSGSELMYGYPAANRGQDEPNDAADKWPEHPSCAL